MSVYQQLRPDGRDWNHLRPLKIEINPLSRSDGSSRVSCGSTSVIAGVTGPVESKSNQDSLEILIRPSNGIPTEFHRLLEDQFIRILRHQISVPTGSTVNIYCEILTDDGSVPGAVLNAVSLALVAAGVLMQGTLLAVSYISKDERTLLDPDLAEEQKYGAVPTIVFDAVSGKVQGLIGNHSVNGRSVFESLAIGSAAVAEILEICRNNFRSYLMPLTAPRI